MPCGCAEKCVCGREDGCPCGVDCVCSDCPNKAFVSLLEERKDQPEGPVDSGLMPVGAFSYPVLNQIRLLVVNLSKKSFKSGVSELKELARLYGEDAHLFLLRCLFEEIDFLDHKSQKDQYKQQLLSQEIAELCSWPNFTSLICQAVRPSVACRDFFQHFSKTLKLPLPQQVLVALGLMDSRNPKLRQEASEFLQVKLHELSDFSNDVLPESVVHRLVFFVRRTSMFDHRQKTQYVEILHQRYPTAFKDHTFLPLLDAFNVNSKPLPVDVEASEALCNQLSTLVRPADLLRDIGSEAMESVATLRAFLEPLERLSEQDVARIIALMINGTERGEGESVMCLKTVMETALLGKWDVTTKLEGRREERKEEVWNVDVFVKTIRELYPPLNWIDVFRKFDFPGFFVSDRQSLKAFFRIYRRAIPNSPFDLDIVLSTWQNKAAQLSLLVCLLTDVSPADPFLSFLTTPQRQKPLELNNMQTDVETYMRQNHPWFSLDLLRTLLRLGEGDYREVVRQLLEEAQTKCPEVLLCGLVEANQHSPLTQDILKQLLPIYFAPHLNSTPVLQRLWNLDKTVVIRWLAKLYRRDRACLARILDIAQDLKEALPVILDSPPFAAAMDLAALAASREYLNLEKWLKERLLANGEACVTICTQFLQHEMERAAGKGAEPACPLPIETVKTFFQCLTLPKVQKELSEEAKERVKALFKLYNQSYPELASTDEIDDEANMYFQKIYAKQMSLDEVVSMLKRFKNSPNRREREIFACMIHNLFDEYRFFNKYPEFHLQVTGILFGRLIQHQLVHSMTLGIALRYVLEALRNSPDSKLFKFGVWALEQFSDRLPEWPKYCSLVAQIPHLRLELPNVVDLLQEIIRQHPALSSPASQPEPEHGQPSPMVSPPMTVSSTVSTPSRTKAAISPLVRFQPAGLPLPPPHPPPVMSEEPAGTRTVQAEAPFAPIVPSQFTAPAQFSAPVHFTSPANSNFAVQHGNSPQSFLPPLVPNAFSGSAPLLPMPSTAKPPLPPAATRTPSTNPSILGASTVSDTLLKGQTENVVEPDETVKDELHRIFNGVSRSNLRQKAVELKELLTPEHYHYLAQYLVVHRCCTQSNLHKLYQQLLDGVGDRALLKLVNKITYENVKLLLSSDKVLRSSDERRQLKNLGAWLGLATLARNKPILAKYIGLKELVLDAYDRDRLIAVIPFVSKVLGQCAMSTIFKPPNPWLMPIVRVLREIYDIEGLKLNLKFEIEVLFKNLHISLQDVEPSSLLLNRPPPVAAAVSATPIDPAVFLPRDPAAQTSSHPEASLAVGLEGLASPSHTAGTGIPLGFGLGDGPYHSSTAGAANGDTHIIRELHTWVQIHPNIALFNMFPQLKRCVDTAVDRAIREIINPVVERSVTIACVTTRELIIKDFASEPDERKMRKAAHHMVQSLTSSLALVTCKEPLRVSINNHLGSLLEANMTSTKDEHTLHLMEQACVQVAADNLELGCAIIEKAASERAVREVDDALASEYTTRIKRREQFGQSYGMFDRYNGSEGELYGQSGSGLDVAQLSVYEDFAHISAAVNGNAVVPRATTGPPPTSAPPRSLSPRAAGQSPQQAVDRLLQVFSSLESSVSNFANAKTASLSDVGSQHEISGLIRLIPGILSDCSRENEKQAAFSFAQKLFNRLYKSPSCPQLLFESVLALLKYMLHRVPNLASELTSWVFYLHSSGSVGDEAAVRPFSVSRESTFSLLRARLVAFAEFDVQLAKLLSAQHVDVTVVEFSVTMARQLMVKEQALEPREFPKLLSCLGKVASVLHHEGEKSLPPLIVTALEEVRKISSVSPKSTSASVAASLRTASPAMPAPARRSELSVGIEEVKAKLIEEAGRDLEESGREVRRRATFVLEEWLQICMQGSSEYSKFMAMLNTQGMFASKSATVQFFRVMIEVSVQAAVPAEEGGSLKVSAVDALSKLLLFVVKYIDQPPSTKISLLATFLAVLVRVVVADAEAKKTKFNQRPFLRLFASLLHDLHTPDPSFDSNNPLVLTSFAVALHLLQPERVPGFAFAWLELISHRVLMPKLLLPKNPSLSSLFKDLLVDLFSFLHPFLRTAELRDSIRLLYKGSLRVLLVLLHDFPEFLCAFHFSLCDVIPPTCIQMRNLILSAFPHTMRLPDPFTPNLKVDLLPEISQPPTILSDYTGPLQQPLNAHQPTMSIQQAVDQYIQNGVPGSPQGKKLLSDLRELLVLPAAEAKKAGTMYNVLLINSLVLHLGQQSLKKTDQNPLQFQNNTCMDLFAMLVQDLEREGSYFALNAIANQLRFPNHHTHYFSCVLLFLFLQSNDDSIKEQITRVLLERLIVHRPHPWGLLITFIELIKNPSYDFWEQPFTRCAPEIERLFESVARSCIPSKGAAGGAGGIGAGGANTAALPAARDAGASSILQARVRGAAPRLGQGLFSGHGH